MLARNLFLGLGIAMAVSLLCSGCQKGTVDDNSTATAMDAKSPDTDSNRSAEVEKPTASTPLAPKGEEEVGSRVIASLNDKLKISIALNSVGDHPEIVVYNPTHYLVESLLLKVSFDSDGKPWTGNVTFNAIAKQVAGFEETRTFWGFPPARCDGNLSFEVISVTASGSGKPPGE